jgi:hypothetical protein
MMSGLTTPSGTLTITHPSTASPEYISSNRNSGCGQLYDNAEEYQQINVDPESGVILP